MSIPPEHPDPSSGRASADSAASRARFHRTLIRVFAVQAVALLVLWFLQSRYGL